MKSRQNRLNFRKLRIRQNIIGTSNRPRLSVYRSLKHIYAQVIDDFKGRTLASASSLEKAASGTTGKSSAEKVGELVAKKAVEKGIKSVIFDRGGRPYHGQVKSLAEGARKGGLNF